MKAQYTPDEYVAELQRQTTQAASLVEGLGVALLELAADGRKILERGPVPRPPHPHQHHLSGCHARRRGRESRPTGASHKGPPAIGPRDAFLRKVLGTASEDEDSRTQKDRSAFATLGGRAYQVRGDAELPCGVFAAVRRS